jgi:hypothetical protein
LAGLLAAQCLSAEEEVHVDGVEASGARLGVNGRCRILDLTKALHSTNPNDVRRATELAQREAELAERWRSSHRLGGACRFFFRNAGGGSLWSSGYVTIGLWREEGNRWRFKDRLDLPRPGPHRCTAVFKGDYDETYWFGPATVKIPEWPRDSTFKAEWVLELYDVADELSPEGEPLTELAAARIGILVGYIESGSYVPMKYLPAVPCLDIVRAARKRITLGQWAPLRYLARIGRPLDKEQVDALWDQPAVPPAVPLGTMPELPARFRASFNPEALDFIKAMAMKRAKRIFSGAEARDNLSRHICHTDPTAFVEWARTRLSGDLGRDAPLIEILIAAGSPAETAIENLPVDEEGVRAFLDYCLRFGKPVPDASIRRLLEIYAAYEKIERVLTLGQHDMIRNTVLLSEDGMLSFRAKAVLSLAGDEDLRAEIMASAQLDRPSGGSYQPGRLSDTVRSFVESLPPTPKRLRAIYDKHLMRDVYTFGGSGNAATTFSYHPLPEHAPFITAKLEPGLQGLDHLMLGLGQLDYKPAATRIMEVLEALPIDDRRRRCDGYVIGTWALRLLAVPELGKRVVAQIDRVSAIRDPDRDQCRALIGLVKALGAVAKDFPPARDRLRTVADKAGPHSVLRIWTLRELVRAGDPTALNDLVQGLGDAPLHAKPYYTSAIGLCGDKSAIPACRASLASPSLLSRVNAAWAVLALGDESGLDTLYENRFTIIWMPQLMAMLLDFWAADPKGPRAKLVRDILSRETLRPPDTPLSEFISLAKTKQWRKTHVSHESREAVRLRR